MLKASLTILCLVFVLAKSEICFPWPADQYITGTVSNFVADSCCGIADCATSNRAFYFQGLNAPYDTSGTSGSLLGWDPSQQNTFIYDPVHQTITVTGRVIGTNLAGSGFPVTPPAAAFDVQLTFSDVVPCIDSAVIGTPISGLKQESTCYGKDVNGAEISAYCWYCSDNLVGTFTATSTSLWYPTVFSVTNNMVSEFGFGANGGDAALGMSAWITLITPTGPNNLPPQGYSVVPGGTNDLDCNLNCDSVCSINIVFTPQCSSSCKKVVVYIGSDSVKTKVKEDILCNGDCLTLQEAAGTSIWLHIRDRTCNGDCGDTETIFKIDDICTATCLNDPKNELQLIHNSGAHCGLPCPQNFLGPS